MIDTIPAHPWMVDKLQLQKVQALNGQVMTREAVQSAIQGGMAIAGVDGDRLFGMAGIFERWDGVGLAWALLAEDFASHRLTIFKLMKRALDLSTFDRVEAYVVEGHESGERLLEHLGFAKEGVMRKFWNGKDHTLYARVRG
jgi:hypothetical protein